MLKNLEALSALEKMGTISEAATRLRISQSAVTKRIQALRDEVGFDLIEPDGRRVRLTQRGSLFLERARPLLVELNDLKELKEGGGQKTLSLGMSDSIAASWGPELIRKALTKLKNIKLEIHVHRSALVLEKVKMGRYQIGLCVPSESHRDLTSFLIAEEALAVVASRLRKQQDPQKPLLTIEKASSTWDFIEPHLKKILGPSQEIVHVESFAAALQMCKEGFGNALVPLGLATKLGIHSQATDKLQFQIGREIRVFCRKMTAQSLEFKALHTELLTGAKDMLFLKR